MKRPEVTVKQLAAAAGVNKSCVDRSISVLVRMLEK